MSAWAGSEHLSHEQENIHSDLSTAEINTLVSIQKYFDFAKKYFDFDKKYFDFPPKRFLLCSIEIFSMLEQIILDLDRWDVQDVQNVKGNECIINIACKYDRTAVFLIALSMPAAGSVCT